MDSVINARIDLGVRLLDETYGREWPRKVILRDLFMASGYHCVVGQLGGKHFANEITERGWGTQHNINHGFTCDERASYSTLQTVWYRRIQALREERGITTTCPSRERFWDWDGL